MSLFEVLLENIYPKRLRCVCCNNDALLNQYYLCPKCAKGLVRNKRCCPVCGRSNNGEVCDDCKLGRPFIKTVAPYKYVASAKGMVRALKYKSCVYLAPVMAAEIAPLCDFGHIDIVTAAPIKTASFIRRCYNQSSHLGYQLAKILNLPFCDMLAFCGSIKQQHTLNKNQRGANYEDNVLCINDVSGKSVLLVDDILTTGATATACANALIKNGATAVYVAVFATVPFVKKTDTTKKSPDQQKKNRKIPVKNGKKHPNNGKK